MQAMTRHDKKYEEDRIEPLEWYAPFHWLALGARDLSRNPLPGVLHGLALSLFGLLLYARASGQFWWLVGAVSGFMIVAPVMATGLYAISREADQGRVVSCKEVYRVWTSGDRRLMTFGFLLCIAGTGWVLTSAGLITLWSEVPIKKPLDFLQHVVLGESWLFEVWLLVGAVMAAPMFASSVITLPLLVDTRGPLWWAVAQSWRAVATYPATMALWALLISFLVALGFATLTLGLIVFVPVLGHGSWHAYQGLKRAGFFMNPGA